MIIVGIRAGLGNQMFQYAYARALQKTLQTPVKIETKVLARDKKEPGNIYRHYGLSKFNITLRETDLKRERKFQFLFKRTLGAKICTFLSKKHIFPYKYYNFGQKFYNRKDLNLKGNCLITGWFQDERYFKGIRKILLKEFQPQKEVLLPNFIKDLLQNNAVISLHIRRGDYKKYNNNLPLDYYTKAMEYIKLHCDSPVFLIFSDEVAWVKERLKSSETIYFIEDYVKLEDYEQLWIMSKCKHNIIANSTFSWWAGWLNQNPNKIVVAPRKWFPMQKDILPKEWIVI